MNKKTTIIAIVGESGAGKTSLALYLRDHYNVPIIASYTTRPMREGEENGVDHTFMLPNTPMPPISQLCAYTVFSGHKYWTLHSQINIHNVCTYVVDEVGLLKLSEHDHLYDIVAVKLLRPNNPTDIERKRRDKGRIHIEDECYDLRIVNREENLQDFLENASKQVADFMIHKNYFQK